jgi:primosomal protein N' (replication factor Y)
LTADAAIARVALDVPIPELFDYQIAAGWRPEVGDWVVVPWGRSRRVGLVAALADASDVPEERLKPLEAPLLGMPRMPAHWLDLIEFGARYYHAGFGELALPSVPKLLRMVPTARSRGSAAARARERFDGGAGMAAGPAARAAEPDDGAAPDPGQAAREAADAVHRGAAPPALTAEQVAALAAIEATPGHAVHLLHGITGSGKTEVYFRWLESRLGADPAAQALVLVPEIALTPQFARRIRERFPGLSLAVLHSDMPDAERAAHWLAAAEGRARIVLGTRLAVLAPLPGLVAIVVDEEHDASFKQQEGARYSARDLAIALAARRGLPVVLGSATPSLETWAAVRRGRYRIERLRERASGAPLPVVQRISLQGAALQHGLTATAIAMIVEAVGRGEQALLYLNRRGYAPVLNCSACGWLSRCDQCDAYRVLHRVGPLRAAPGAAAAGRTATARAAQRAPAARARMPAPAPAAGRGAPRDDTLRELGRDLAFELGHDAALASGTAPVRPGAEPATGPSPTLAPEPATGPLSRYRLVCHHCGSDQRVPRACPECGNVDLAGLGRGTQRLEEGLQSLFPAARIGRLDRDVARRRGAAQSLLDAVHAGEVDLLVGTQMLAKGHDFRRLTLVVVVDADAGLFAADFRAPERLFATLMQVAGRAGRHHAASRVLIQTRFPDHPVYAALAAHDYDRFAAQQLEEREQAGLPPFVHQALLTAQAKNAEAAAGFLAAARDCLVAGDTDPSIPADALAALTVCDPVPMPLAQMRGETRVQMLVESASRPALHAALGPWLHTLRAMRSSVRWQLVVDPLEI